MRRTVIVNVWPAVTPGGRSTVNRPAKLAPVPAGIGMEVKPRGTTHRIVCASAAVSWCVE